MILKLLITLLFSYYQCAVGQEVYNTYSQGPSYGNGGAYVAPIVTKTYITNYTNTYYGTQNSGRTAATAGSVTVSYNTSASSRNIFYRSSWSRRIDRFQRKQLSIAREKAIEAKAWKNQADEVLSYHKLGNSLKAEEIRRSIYMTPPPSLGGYLRDNYPDPSIHYYSIREYELKYTRAYHFVCIQLLAELKNYKGVLEFYHKSFSQGTLKGSYKYKEYYDLNDYNYIYNHQEQTDYLIKCFKDFSYPDILKLESLVLEALTHESGIHEARKRWTAISEFYLPYIKSKVTDKNEKSLCYNIIAMVQLQLGRSEEAVSYFKKQLALSPGDEILHFSVYQNIVEFLLSSSQKNDQLIHYCLDGLDKLLGQAVLKKHSPELIYFIKYNTATLLLVSKDLQKAEEVVNSQQDISNKNKFSHNLLKASILIQLINKLGIQYLLPTEGEQRKKLFPTNTPAQRQVFDSLYIAGYFDNKGPDYMQLIFNKTQELTKVKKDLFDEATSFSSLSERVEMDVVLAEEQVLKKDYEGASLSYELIAGFSEDNWPYLMRLAEIYYNLNNSAKSISILNKTILDNEDEYQLYVVLADILRKTGQSKKAKENYILAKNKGAFLQDDILTYLTDK